MAILTLPLRPDLEVYEFETELDDVTYRIALAWNGRESAWFLDLFDGDGEVIRSGTRIVLDFPLYARDVGDDLPPGQLIAIDTARSGVPPGLNDLGARVQLLYVEAAELG